MTVLYLIFHSVGGMELFLPDRFSTTVSANTPPVRLRPDLAYSCSNLVYIGIFFTVQMAFTLVAASYFAAADGHKSTSIALKKTGGVFAFLSGLLGYYTVGNLMCQDALGFPFPMGDTSHYFRQKKESKE